MDPLTAFSVAGTAISLTNFLSKLISAGHTLYPRSVLPPHRQAENAGKDLRCYSARLRGLLHVSRSSGCLSDVEAAKVEALCQQTDKIASDLSARLDELKPKKHDDKASARVTGGTPNPGFKSLWSQEELGSMQTKLAEFREFTDLTMLPSLSRREDAIALDQSEIFKHLDEHTKSIAAALLKSQPKGQGHDAPDAVEARVLAASQLLSRSESVADFLKAGIGEPSSASADFQASSGSPLLGSQSRELRLQKQVTQEILESLSVSLQLSKTHRYHENIPEAHEQTFEWVFEAPEETVQFKAGRRWSGFAEWLETGSGLYWISGDAASGKSTMMRHIADHPATLRCLSRWSDGAKLCKPALFFQNSGSRLQKSQEGLLRTLLYEVLSSVPEIVPWIFPERWSSVYCAKQEFSRCALASEPWLHFATLKNAFVALLRQTSVPLKLCLFVDGLDEYEGDHGEIAELFGVGGGGGGSSNAAQPSNSGFVKICVSSRPYPAFTRAFGTQPSLRMQELTHPDIERYVSDKLMTAPRVKELAAAEPEGVRDLCAEIATSAGGVFLWAVLVVASLRGGLGNSFCEDDVSCLRERLQELPKGLEDLFDHLVFRVDGAYQDQASRLFQLVAEAHDSRDCDLWPLDPLSVLDIYLAELRPHQAVFKPERVFQTEGHMTRHCQQMARTITSRSGGLLEVQSPQRRGTAAPPPPPHMTVAYVHRTVSDYFKKRGTRKLLAERARRDDDGGPFNPAVALLRSSILSLKNDFSGPADPDLKLFTACVTYARRIDAGSRGLPRAEIALFDEFHSASAHLRVASARGLRLRPWPSMLCLAAQLGLANYVRAKFFQSDYGKALLLLRAAPQLGQPPLLEYALAPFELSFSPEEEDGEEEVIVPPPNLAVLRDLLDFGADPNEQFAGTTPWKGVLVSLGKEMSPTSTAFCDRAGIRWAPRRDNWAEVVSLYLDHGADPHAVVEVGRSRSARDIVEEYFSGDLKLLKRFESVEDS